VEHSLEELLVMVTNIYGSARIQRRKKIYQRSSETGRSHTLYFYERRGNFWKDPIDFALPDWVLIIDCDGMVPYSKATYLIIAAVFVKNDAFVYVKGREKHGCGTSPGRWARTHIQSCIIQVGMMNCPFEARKVVHTCIDFVTQLMLHFLFQ